MSAQGVPRQLPLDLGHRAGQSRDDLVVSQANAAAVRIVEDWPKWPSPVIVIAGPAGSGKSHLAAIWRERSDASLMRGASIGAYPSDGNAPGPVLIDDADAGQLDEHGLFHLFNAIAASGQHLLLTSRRFPGAWGVTLPDLASRLKAATTVEIYEPDDALLAGVITKLFADRQVEVDPNVVQFLVRRIERSLSTAMRVVERLDAFALERKTPITRALAAETLSAFDEGQAELDL